MKTCLDTALSKKKLQQCWRERLVSKTLTDINNYCRSNS